MGGRGLLIVILGVAYILVVFQSRTGNLSTEALENYLDYHSYTTGHQIAVSGLNIAAAKLYENYGWRGPLNNVPLNGGSFSLSFAMAGDTLAVASIASFDSQTDTVIAFFSGSNDLTKYTWYTVNENGVAWTPGDSIYGPIHTNGRLNHQNKSSIVFTGKVTAGKGISAPPKNSKTQFLGGYEVGVYNTVVADMNQIISMAGSGGYFFSSNGATLTIKFNSDGTVDIDSAGTELYDDELLSNIAANGVLYSDGDILITGGGKANTAPGGFTIGSANEIRFEDEVTYYDNPRTNPSSDDILAFVAWNDLVIDNSSKSNWNMQCVLMSINGSLTATNMNKNGTFNFYGSTYQSVRGNAKMFKSFNKRYRHDDRLNNITPPGYPGMSGLRLLAWWE